MLISSDTNPRAAVRFSRLIYAISDKGPLGNLGALMAFHPNRWLVMHDASHLPEILPDKPAAKQGGLGVLVVAPTGDAYAVWAGMDSVDADHAEICGTLLAMAFAKQMGAKEILLVGDSRNAIRDTASHRAEAGEHPALAKLYQTMKSEFDFVSRGWVPRTENRVADRLAAGGSLIKPSALGQIAFDAGFRVGDFPTDERLNQIPGFKPWGMTHAGAVIKRAKAHRDALAI